MPLSGSAVQCSGVRAQELGLAAMPQLKLAGTLTGRVGLEIEVCPLNKGSGSENSIDGCTQKGRLGRGDSAASIRRSP